MNKEDQIRKKKKIECITEERIDNAKFKTFWTKLILPSYLKYFFPRSGGIVYPDKEFLKKKDSENYAYLLAVKRLYDVGLYGDDLYPNLNRYLNKKLLTEDPKDP